MFFLPINRSIPGERHEDELGVHHVAHLRARYPGVHGHQGDQLLPEQRGRHHVPCGHPDDQQTLEDLCLQQVGEFGWDVGVMDGSVLF